MLIDFGRSFRVQIGGPVSVIPGLVWSNYLLSPWEIAGERITRRDDVYRVLLMLSYMLSGKAGIKAAKELDVTPRLAHDWRMTGKMFGDEKLNEAMKLARRMKIDEEPDYGLIIEKLKDARIL